MSVQRRTTASGVRWDVRLRDPTGRVYTRTFHTRRAADAYERSERTKRDRGEWIDPRAAAISFADWASVWLGSNPAKRPKSRATDEGVIRRHLNPVLGRRPVGSITPRDVQGLVADWTATYSPASVRRFYATLRAIFAAAVDHDVIGRSPCRRINLPEMSRADRPVVEPDVVASIAEAIDDRYVALVWTLAETGLRIGEAAGLRVGRLDFMRHTLTVAETVQEVRGQLIVGPPKSRAGRRTIRISGALTERLSIHLAERGLTAANPEELVFSAPNGGPLRYGLFRSRYWVPAVTAAGHPWVRPHDLRRAATTAMVSAGVDPRTAQHRLGHSDVRMTLEVYAQRSETADAEAAELLAGRLGRATSTEPLDSRSTYRRQ